MFARLPTEGFINFQNSSNLYVCLFARSFRFFALQDMREMEKERKEQKAAEEAERKAAKEAERKAAKEAAKRRKSPAGKKNTKRRDVPSTAKTNPSPSTSQILGEPIVRPAIMTQKRPEKPDAWQVRQFTVSVPPLSSFQHHPHLLPYPNLCHTT